MALSGLVVGTATAALLSLAVSPLASAQLTEDKPRVLIVETRPIVVPGAGRRSIRGEVETAIRAAGGDVVYLRRPPVAEARCTDAVCFAQMATAAQATHVMRIDGEYANEGYRLFMELWNAGTQETTRGDSLKCEVCTGKELVAAAREQSMALCAKQFREAGAQEVSRPVPLAQTPAATTVPAPAAVPSLPAVPAAAEADASWQSWLPWTAIGLGVAGAVWGGYLLGIDGRCRDSQCIYRRDTRLAGWVSLGTGAGVAALGGWALYAWRTPSGTVANPRATAMGWAVGRRF